MSAPLAEASDKVNDDIKVAVICCPWPQYQEAPFAVATNVLAAWPWLTPRATDQRFACNLFMLMLDVKLVCFFICRRGLFR